MDRWAREGSPWARSMCSGLHSLGESSAPRGLHPPLASLARSPFLRRRKRQRKGPSTRRSSARRTSRCTAASPDTTPRLRPARRPRCRAEPWFSVGCARWAYGALGGPFLWRFLRRRKGERASEASGGWRPRGALDSPREWRPEHAARSMGSPGRYRAPQRATPHVPDRARSPESATGRMIPCCEPRESLRAPIDPRRANPGRGATGAGSSNLEMLLVARNTIGASSSMQGVAHLVGRGKGSTRERSERGMEAARSAAFTEEIETRAHVRRPG